jgi:hypothetical protein
MSRFRDMGSTRLAKLIPSPHPIYRRNARQRIRKAATAVECRVLSPSLPASEGRETRPLSSPFPPHHNRPGTTPSSPTHRHTSFLFRYSPLQPVENVVKGVAFAQTPHPHPYQPLTTCEEERSVAVGGCGGMRGEMEGSGRKDAGFGEVGGVGSRVEARERYFAVAGECRLDGRVSR